MKWAKANGCPWDAEECMRLATLGGHKHVLVWIEANLC